MCSTFDLMSLVLVLPDFLVCFISYCDLTYDLAHLSMTEKSVVGGWVSQWVNEARVVVDASRVSGGCGPHKLPETGDSHTILHTKPEFCKKSSLLS